MLLAVEAVAHALGYIVVVNRRYTDLFERGQRTEPLSLAAEIQRRLLPSAFTHETRQFTVAGWLEPAATVGGDTFDYAVDHGMLHVSITDAVGNDVNAALLATVLVGSLRNGRRQGMTLADQTRLANDALAEHSPVGEFVTGQVLRVDLDTGLTTLVNAGHLFPLLLRDGPGPGAGAGDRPAVRAVPGPGVPAAAAGAAAGGPAAAGHRRGAGPQQRPPRGAVGAGRQRRHARPRARARAG